MRVVEALGIAALILFSALILIYARREVISRRGGTIEMYMRLSTYVPGRGWAPGVGLFTPDQLRWFRVFSLGLRPRRVLLRHGLMIEERRQPEGAEKLAMPEGWVILRCRPVTGAGARGAGSRDAGWPRAGSRGAGSPGSGSSEVVLPRTGTSGGPAVELALAENALSGFLSWLESAPPRTLRMR